MEKWEYLILSIMNVSYEDVQKRFNQYGAMGWELVCKDGATYIFKRRKA